MQLTERLLGLCAIPSVTGAEGMLADEVQRQLEALRLPEAVRRHGHSLVAPLTRGSGGPKLLLVTQLDTAEVGQHRPPREEGGWVYAPGSADSKSGASLLLDLAERRPVLKADVTLVFHARGEAGAEASGLKLVVHREPELARVDFALVLKPTDNKLQLGCGGSTHAVLAFAGRYGHSGLPDAGVNPIHRFARVLTQLAATEPVADVVEGLTWYEILNATSAHAGQPLQSVVPHELEVYVHHTFGPSTDVHDSQDKLIALMDRVGAVRFDRLSAAAAPAPHHPLVQSLQRSASLAIEARQTWTEVSRFAALGIPAANFGPGAERSVHTRKEGVSLEALEAARTILERWLSTLG